MPEELTHRDFSKRGGKSRSPKKIKAVRENVKKAREAKKGKA